MVELHDWTINYILTIGYELSTLAKYPSTSEQDGFTTLAHSDLGEGTTSDVFANPRAIDSPEHVHITDPCAPDNQEHVYVSIPSAIDNPEHIHIPNPSAIYNPEHVYVTDPTAADSPEHVYVTDPTATDSPEHVYASLNEVSTDGITGKSVKDPQFSDKGN